MTNNQETPTITNFRQINDWFYRGGQPLDDQFTQLTQLGIKTIICLRWNKKVIKHEAEIARDHNLEFVPIPLTYWRLPNREEIDKFFSIVSNESKKPIYLHCKHGSDRTGMLAAFYRIRVDGWSFEQAYDEMKASGFHKIKMHHFKYAVSGFAKKENAI